MSLFNNWSVSEIMVKDVLCKKNIFLEQLPVYIYKNINKTSQLLCLDTKMRNSWVLYSCSVNDCLFIEELLSIFDTLRGCNCLYELNFDTLKGCNCLYELNYGDAEFGFTGATLLLLLLSLKTILSGNFNVILTFVMAEN